MDLSVQILSRLRWELVRRSVSSAPTFFFIGVIIFFYQFNVQNHTFLIEASMVGAILAAAVRYVVTHRALNEQIDPDKASQWVSHSVVLNTITWGVTFWTTCWNLPIDSPDLLCAFLLLFGYTTSSIVTLAYVPRLALGFQFALVSAPISSFLYRYFETKQSYDLVVAICMTAFLLFLAKQTLDLYRQMVEKIRHELELEESLGLLKASNQRVLEETARAHNAARFAALGELAGGVAHEINNPLSIVLGLLRVLQDRLKSIETGKPLDPAMGAQLIDNIERAVKSGGRIAQIVKSLRNICSYDSPDDDPTSVHVESLFSDILSVVSEKFSKAGIHISAETSPDLEVIGNPAILSQVLLSLLNNAYDAVNESPTSNKYVRIFSAIEAGFLKISVENSGPMIPPEVRNKLFQPFFTTKKFGGASGLGLSVSRGLAESMKGRLWFDETRSQVTFCLSLPTSESAQIQAA